jgi:DNA polymerase-3 subunit gamma/tau
VVSEPCGRCESCLAVDEGRFVDLIEVDAASRTGVDDTRELLENVQYAPTVGRYKVYLIDEVHMLSKQSFNALLKTLEEPPPHVKFLFATTDPQKLPITVLSRCLQFNLKSLPIALIDDRMRHILEAEGIEAEPAGVTRIARAAAGSMRDALSLLDQALAFGDSSIRDTDVAAMLGTMDRHRVVALVDQLATGDAKALLAGIRGLDEDVPDYHRVLDELAGLLQRIAVLQLVGDDALEDEDQLEKLQRLAGEIDPAQIQLYYQIAITSRRDLDLAPDPRLGFEMALLRMLAFRAGERPAAERPATREKKPAAQRKPPAKPPAAAPPPATDRSPPSQPSEWPSFIEGLPVRGAARQLAENCALTAGTPFELRLQVEKRSRHLATDKLKERLAAAVQEHLGSAIRLDFSIGEEAADTVARRAQQAEQATLQQARDKIAADPQLKELEDLFDAEVIPDSIQPAARD